MSQFQIHFKQLVLCAYAFLSSILIHIYILCIFDINSYHLYLENDCNKDEKKSKERWALTELTVQSDIHSDGQSDLKR